MPPAAQPRGAPGPEATGLGAPCGRLPHGGDMTASRTRHASSCDRCALQTPGTGSTLIAVGLPTPLSNAVDAWSEYADGRVCNVVKAAGFVRFALSLDAENGRRVVEPRHHVIDFPLREQGRQKHQSALFTLRVVREEDISRDPNAQGAVANHLRFKPPAERRLIPGADEYVEFELLSREHEVPSQQPLRISMGPVRADKQTGQQEFVRVDMGQCIQRIATDIVEDPRGGQRLVQNRWWMCVETLRLLCNVDHIDCTALDKPGVPPQEWVIRLMDAHAPINRKEELQERHEDRDIDDLMEFIDSRGPGRGAMGGVAEIAAHLAAPVRAAKARRKKSVREKEATEDAANGACRAGSSTPGAVGTAGAAAATAAASPAGMGAGDASTGDSSDSATPSGAGHNGAAGPGVAAALEEDEVRREESGGGGGSASARAAAAAAPAGGAVPAVPSLATPAPAAASQQEAPAESSAAEEGPGAAAPEDATDVDLMGELLARYRRLQERSGRAEIDAKVAVVRDLLEVLDELEHADAEIEEDSAASRLIFSAARKFEAKLRSMGLLRIEGTRPWASPSTAPSTGQLVRRQSRSRSRRWLSRSSSLVGSWEGTLCGLRS